MLHCRQQAVDGRSALMSGGHAQQMGCLSAGFGFNASRQDVIFVNGGLQPKIRIAPGVPQLWCIVNAAWKVRMLQRTGCEGSAHLGQWSLASSSVSQDAFGTRPCSEVHPPGCGMDRDWLSPFAGGSHCRVLRSSGCALYGQGRCPLSMQGAESKRPHAQAHCASCSMGWRGS